MKNKLTLIVKEEANIEVVESYIYYENELVGLGERFIFELEKVIFSINKVPNGFQIFHNDTRQAPFHVFPYLVVYKVIDDTLIILSVFKTPQNPKKKIKFK